MEGPKSFSHLFPPVAVTKTPNLDDPSGNAGRLANGGVDYVIELEFPADKKSRNTVEPKVLQSLQTLKDKLSKSGLQYQVKPGRTPGQLLILVVCPLSTLQVEFRRQR